MRGARTDRKRAIFSFLQTATNSGAEFPTPRDLERTIGAKGGVFRDGGRTRGGRALRPNFTRVAIVGTVSAGYGDPLEPAEMGSIPVNLEALNIKATTRTFALKVRGDSMVGAQIADGDLVIIEAREPKVGEIVAALIDGETTLKRFVAKDGRLFLQAENPRYPDLIPLVDLTIQGVMRAVVRVCDPSRRDA